ncbi:SixA phosphatase family protein [Parahaliea mediterranea]|uniref:Histidine phosphatase family protein n=1 Tax=Parahaliea mediterranea TaxID=651086 RepID=A0A939IKL0_9GAMM|nr:hypothetical protein [Parahaliea mediterranea]MBN7798869.1 hypothetical protein [Parahaliea mediterranea]
MIVTVWRHGEAGQAAEDRLRELTPAGERDVALGARRLREICRKREQPLPDALLYSRWQRTTRTARLIAAEFASLSPVAEDSLIPGCSPAHVESTLDRLWCEQRPPEHLVLVSHQPLVTRLVDHLTGQRGAVPPHPPGGLVTLSVEVPAAVGAGLLWWAFPPNYEACV